jgi:sugar/nucleoside kinase (ribokinase family)
VSKMASRRPVVVVGATVADVIARPTGGQLILGSSSPGQVSLSMGGVGRNIAEGLARLCVGRGGGEVCEGGPKPILVTVVGDDTNGLLATAHAERVGIDTSLFHTATSATPSYVAVMDEGNDLLAAIADFSAIEELAELTAATRTALRHAPAVVIDANVPLAVLAEIEASIAPVDEGQIVWWEPTSVAKGAVVLDSAVWRRVTHTSPNVAELLAMAHAAEARGCLGSGLVDTKAASEHAARHAPALTEAVAAAVAEEDPGRMLQLLQEPLEAVLLSGGPHSNAAAERHAVVTLGEHGVLLASADMSAASVCRAAWCPAWPLATEPTNATGAGDTLVASVVWQLLSGRSLEHAVAGGTVAAAFAVESLEAVPPSLSAEALSSDAAVAALRVLPLPVRHP